MMPHKLFKNCNERRPWQKIIQFPQQTSGFTYLDTITLMYSSNFTDVSNIIPKCICNELLKWFVIKENWWMCNFFDLTKMGQD